MGELLSPRLDSLELVAPIAFESAGPIVHWPQRLGVCSIEDLATVSARLDEADVVKHTEVLGDRRLREAEGESDLADRLLVGSEVRQDRTSTGFGDGIERVRRRGGTSHGRKHIPI